MMIFVTVGTHEQGFERLVRKVDELKRTGSIKEEVIMQIGFSQYKPSECDWHTIIAYKKMCECIEKARIVITHGGPASIMLALQYGKIPIVVPRNSACREHVNNHQIEFIKRMEREQADMIPVYDIEELESRIAHYDELIKQMGNRGNGNNKEFTRRLEKIISRLVE